MSESADRKALKDVLAKLKAKTISSQEYYGNNIKATIQRFSELTAKVRELAKGDTTGLAKTYLDMMDLFKRDYYDTAIESLNVLHDYKVYTESLESYFARIDEAVMEFVEQGKKDAQEQIKQQDEIIKKGSTDYIK